MLAALRAFNGQYDPIKLGQIRQFGGSEAYARIIAMKCRGASSLLRDVYLGTDRPWGLQAPADPDIPIDVIQSIMDVVQGEVQNIVQAIRNPQPPPPPPPTPEGQAQQPPEPPPPPPTMPTHDQVRDRTAQLMDDARDATILATVKKAKLGEDKVQTLLDEGGFYKALAEFIVDLPLFPFACMKGPVVKIVTEVQWQNNAPVQTMVPRLCWERKSPFDIWFTPGVADIENAAIIERLRLTRAELNDCLDLPGYDQKALKEVLTNYRHGFVDTWDSTDSSRAVMENRESPLWNQSELITCYEFHGNVQGFMLRDIGWSEAKVPDPMRDYAIEAWMIGPYLIKCQLSPSPRRRPPYYITSFEKVPGTPVGNGLPDILNDIQEMANATVRALSNNMAMASGPQTVVRDDLMTGMETGETIFPWKVWHMNGDPNSGASQKPVEFFQPQSNAQELLGVFTALSGMADDLSAIPRYLQGNSPGGGAGRTASGLAMLMGNASKMLQTVAANIDRDVMGPALHAVLDMVLLTDTGDTLDGTEKVVVKGVNIAVQKETERTRQLEFLQITANPVDMQIMGPKGRAEVLRSVSETIGMRGEKIVPSDNDIAKQTAIAQANAAAQGIPGHGGMGDQAGDAAGGQSARPTNDMGPRTNTASRPRIGGGVG